MELVSCVLCQEIKPEGERGFSLIGMGMDKIAFPPGTRFPVSMKISVWSYWRRLPSEDSVQEFDLEMVEEKTAKRIHLAHATMTFKGDSTSIMVQSRNVRISISDQGKYRFLVTFDKRSFEFWDLRFFLS